MKLQEAVYEIAVGEDDLVEDLNVVRKTYAESLSRLKILEAEETEAVFGPLSAVVPLHEALGRRLKAARNASTGLSGPIGFAMLEWAGAIEAPYVAYCASLIATKAFLDERQESDKDFADFLQRCLESPFSRKLDLWTHLDAPRGRLVKYPLLMKQVLKFSDDPNECSALTSAIQRTERALGAVDAAMAKARCRLTLRRLEWLNEEEDSIASSAVASAAEEMLEGVLRNNRGTKLECHLLDTVFILGRPSSRGRGGPKRLQVYRTPIPVADLVVEDLESAKTASFKSLGSSSGSSFRSTTSSGSGNNEGNSFRVRFREGALKGHNVSQSSHTLTAADEHAKRQWILTLQKTIDAYTNKKRPIQSAVVIEEEETDSSAKKTRKKSFILTPKKSLNVARLKHHQGGGGRNSPRIKASLSYAALEMRSSNKKLQAFKSNGFNSTSALKRPLVTVTKTPNENLFKQRPHSTSDASLRKPKKKMSPLREESNVKPMMRSRTKTWNHVESEEPRYLTRSRVKKISKSMSDLINV